MQVAILDCNYVSQKYKGLAASWLSWEANRAGVDVVPPSCADVVLMTVSSQQGVAGVKRLKREARDVPVVLGGGGCWGPVVFDDYADLICVGEGQRFIRTLFSKGLAACYELPEAYWAGKKARVFPGRCFPFDCPPLLHPDGTVRVWGSRGCVRKCLFCQTGWEQPYQPHPHPAWIKTQVQHLKRKKNKVSVITNDGATHDLLDVMGQQEFVSVTLHNIEKVRIDRNYAKGVRLGVEGVSERLRRAVKKPISNDDLVKFTHRCWDNGVGVRWFFIAGLPKESEKDWLELRDLVKKVSARQKGVVMMNFHAFIPQPATPLSVLPLNDEYWEFFEDFRKWFFHGPGFSRRVQIVSPAKYPGRLKRARQSMAASEEELRRGWLDCQNRNWIVEYIAGPERLRSLARKYCDFMETG